MENFIFCAVFVLKLYSHINIYKVTFFIQIISTIHCLESVQIRSYFWSVFSRIRTEYGETLSIFPYSVRMRENTFGQYIWTLYTQ